MDAFIRLLRFLNELAWPAAFVIISLFALVAYLFKKSDQ